MSKYKVGDKIVMEITKIFSDNFGTKDCIVKGFTRCDENCLSEHSEPLSTYTKPLEDKIKKLMEENIWLIAENTKLKAKDDVLKTSCDDYEEKVNDMCDTARAEGQDEAWELARKIILPPSKGGMSSDDYIAIFGSCISEAYVMKNYTYTEAAAKVAEWENEKEEIKVGDIIKIHEVNDDDLCILYVSTDKKYYNAVDEYGAVYNMLTKGMITKTGRHIDIDSFLKQIGGEK